jgi:predicted porin
MRVGNSEIESRNMVSDNISEVRISGKEDLGGGVNAIFQVESRIRGDTGGTTLGSRNNRVGLTGGFGTVFLGQWWSPYYTAWFDFDPFGTYGFESPDALAGNGFTTAGNPSAAGGGGSAQFNRRISNTVQYWTPDFKGFNARVAYGANEEKTATLDPSLWSIAAGYTKGPLVFTVAHERHKDYQAADTTDKGSRAYGSCTLGSTTLAAFYERLDYETGAGHLKRNSWGLSANHNIGRHSLRAMYVHAGNGTGSVADGTNINYIIKGEDTGAEQWTIGYYYAMSKRTDLFAYYARIDNDSNGIYNFDDNAPAAGPLTGIPGAKPAGFSLGMQHRF